MARPEVAAAIADDGLLVVSVHPFLALAAQVEQRVVDSDGHPDDEYELGRAGADREPSAGDAEQRDGRDHCRPGQQDRDAGRDERAEHGQQQDQRQRDRRPLGLPEVAAEQRVGHPVGAGVARLPHQQVRVVRLDRVDRRQVGQHGRVGAELGPATLKVTSATVPCAGQQALTAAAYGAWMSAAACGRAASARLDFAGVTLRTSARCVGSQVPLTGARLDQHALRRRRHHAQLREHLLAPARLARIVLLHARRPPRTGRR